MVVPTEEVLSAAAAPGTSGAALLCGALRAHGVDVLFGYPGGAALPLYRELVRWNDQLRHVLIRHEQNAAHAADGYARATGRVGVCLVTSGPGATNLITGLATAWMDGIPVIALTAQVSTASIGTRAFQEVDIVSVARPVTKGTFQVRCADDIPAMFEHAMRLALSGRPGPVLLDLPKDVLAARVTGDVSIVAAAHPTIDGPSAATVLAIHAVADRLRRAERPVLLAGHGVIRADASAALRVTAERAGAPVGTTLLGLGAFPEDHPLALGMVGMHGTVQANVALHQADLIVGVGTRFDDRVVGRARDFAPGATIVHVDVDPQAFGQVARCDVPILCDVGVFLDALNRELSIGDPSIADRTEWVGSLDVLRHQHVGCGDGDAEGMEGLSSPAVIRALRAASPPAATAVADVGQHQMFAALYWGHLRPGAFFTTGGLGTMGYALPAAMGAQLARPGEVVWAIVGDGGFQMSAPELSTLVAERIPVKIAILNNGCLGMVRQWQELFYDGVYSQAALPQPDFVQLARAHGCFARRVCDPADVATAIDDALRTDGPAVLDFRVQPAETVFPMIPPGATVGEVVCAEGRVLQA